jgi:hypothetical protein
LEVGFAGANAKFAAPIYDFSPFGLSVKTSREVTVGTMFRLGIQLGTDYVRGAAVVRAKTPGGFAVEILSMTPADRQKLWRLYMRMQMAPPTE